METIKLKVADFINAVGCSGRTAYNLINGKTKLPNGNTLKTVIEIQKGRKIKLIITDNKQIEELKQNYNSMKFNELQYYDNETFNESKENSEKFNEVAKSDTASDLVDKVFELSEKFNERLMKVNEELVKYKSQVPLLEDRASREGLYLQEIKDLKRSKMKVIIYSITFIVILAITSVILGFLLVIECHKPPKVITTEKVVEKVVEKPVYRYIKK